MCSDYAATKTVVHTLRPAHTYAYAHATFIHQATEALPPVSADLGKLDTRAM